MSPLLSESNVKTPRAAVTLIPLAVLLCGCGGSKESGTTPTGAEAPVIRIDGSSTVFLYGDRKSVV